MKRTATALTLGLSLATRATLAQTASAPAEEATEATEATRLFSEAKELYAAASYAEACPKFEQSLAKKPGVGTEFNLADCWEKLGRTASAQGLFQKVASETNDLGQAERARRATERADALQPKVTRLVLRLKETSPELVVELDERELAKSAFESPLAVDPGKHVLLLRAPGRRAWSMELVTTADDAGKLIVEVPALEREARPARAAEAKPERAAPATEHHPDPTRRNIALALAGGGALAVLFGVAMGEQYIGSHQDAAAVCAAGRDCTQGEVALHQKLVDDERRSRTWAYVAIPMGGTALAAAAILYFTDPERRAHSQAASLRAAPLLSPGEGAYGASVSGAF